MQSANFLDKKFFTANRKNLVKSLDAQVPIVLTANGLIQKTRDDDTYPFEQDSSFWYLTGIEEPDLILVIYDNVEFIILPERSRHHEIFSEQLSTNKISESSGIKYVFSSSEGWSKLRSILKKTSTYASIKPPAVYLKNYDTYTNPAKQNLYSRVLAENKSVEFQDISQQIITMRTIKTSAEINMIKKAIKLNGDILKIINQNFSHYDSEHDIAAEFNNFYFKSRVKPAFNPIIASGANATILHYNSNSAKLDKNGLLLIDSGVKTGGYCSDITRTFSLKPTARQQAVYKSVKKVQQFAMELIKPGVSFADYETNVAKKMGEELIELGLIKKIDQQSIRKYYPHGTSHSLGIDVHDPANYGNPMQKNMVITVEPGIYIKEENIGVRIEDDVLITDSGCEVLSQDLQTNINKLV